MAGLKVYSDKQGVYEERALPATTGTTIAVGDLVKVASGKVLPIAAGTDLHFGVAQQAVTSAVAGSTVSVLLPNATMYFTVPVDSGSADIANLGKFGQFTGGTGAMTIASASLSTATRANGQCVIMGVDGNDTTGKSYVVRLINSANY